MTTLQKINQNPHWHSWKCSCGCTNGREHDNCTRCGSSRGIECLYMGDSGPVHGGIWWRNVHINRPAA